MKWEKKPPDKVGYWLRINAGGRPQLHYIFEIDGVLVVEWGWSSDTVNMRIDGKIALDKLSFFWWAPVQMPT